MAIEKIELEDGTFECHVANYSEIEEAFNDTTISKAYLDCDIDCNDYGVNFEWSINRTSDIVFDLCKHTIKNIMIKKDCDLFNTSKGYIYVSNGKILNVFNNIAKHIAYHTIFENVSLSINANNVTDTSFYKCAFNCCTMYYESSKLNNNLWEGAIDSSIKNSDIYLKINDVNNKILFNYNSLAPGVGVIDGSRIRGKVEINSNVDYLLSNKAIINSVINLEIPEYKSESTQLKLVNNGSYLISTGVINTEIINNGDDSTYDVGDVITKCNSSFLSDGDWLNINGFAVAQIQN